MRMSKVSAKQRNKTQFFYDQIADVQPFMQRLMGYRKSLARYLKTLRLDVNRDFVVLDAGSGTGLATFAFYSAGYRPKVTYTLDISFNSLKVAKQDFKKDRETRGQSIEQIQGNLLSLPFDNEVFDLVITCGALEYVPLDEGMAELARVLKPRSKMILVPVCSSPISAVLEVIYNFKAYSDKQVTETASKYFKILAKHRFPITEPISWSKTCFLLEKK
mgnify:CR=1 FL=1